MIFHPSQLVYLTPNVCFIITKYIVQLIDPPVSLSQIL